MIGRNVEAVFKAVGYLLFVLNLDFATAANPYESAASLEARLLELSTEISQFGPDGGRRTKEQTYVRARSLFAIGRWQEVLSLCKTFEGIDFEVMCLEANLQTNNYSKAKSDSQGLIPRLKADSQKVVLAKLLNAAQTNDDYEGFDEFYQLYTELEPKPAEKIRYWRGRMSFVAGRYELAVSQLNAVVLNRDFSVKAQYLIASAELALGKSQAASERFAKLKVFESRNADEQEIIDLAALSHAKLLYRLGCYDQAVAAFSKVPKALLDPFEFSWALLRLGDITMADSSRFSGREPRQVLANIEFEDATRLVEALPQFPRSSDSAIQKQLLSAELMQRQENEKISMPHFEQVISQARRLSETDPSADSEWLRRQGQVSLIKEHIAATENERRRVAELKRDLESVLGRSDLEWQANEVGIGKIENDVELTLKQVFNLRLDQVSELENETTSLKFLTKISGVSTEFDPFPQVEKKACLVLEQIESARKAKREALLKFASDELRKLNDTSTKLSKLANVLQGLKTQLVVSLRPKWREHLNQYIDSAQAGLFTTKLRENARLDKRIRELEAARTADIQRLQALFDPSNKSEQAVYNSVSHETARFEEEIRDLKDRQNQKKEMALKERMDGFSMFYDARLKDLYQARRNALASAAKELEVIIQRRPNDSVFTPHALFLLAEKFFELEERRFFEEADSYEANEGKIDFSKTIDSCTQISREFPRFIYMDAVLYLLGISHEYMGNTHESLASFKRLALEFPKSRFVDEVWFRMGNTRFEERQFSEAIAAYERVKVNTSSAYYDRAQYKLAWSYYLLNNFSKAIESFVDVLEYQEKGSSKNSKGSILESEAKEYLAFSFADLDLTNEEENYSIDEIDGGIAIFRHVETFFKQKPRTTWERGVLLNLGDILLRLSKPQGAALAFEHVLKLDPLNEENSRLISRLIGIYDEMTNPEKAVEARERFVQLYRSKAETQIDPELKKKARDYVYYLAQAFHAQGKALARAGEKNRASERHGRAIEFYSEYVREFYVEDNVDQALFYLAETLFEDEQYQKAAGYYGQVRDWPLQTKNRETAALNAVYALEKALPFGLASFESTPKQVFSTAMPGAVIEFIEAVDRAIELSGESEILSAFLFETANAFARFNRWEEAEKRLKNIVTKYPKTKTARLAASQVLNKRLDNSEWAVAAADAAQFSAAKIDNDGDFRRIELEARFKLANECFTSAQTKPEFEKAAKLYLELLNDNPKSGFADKILFNALIALEHAGDVEHSERILGRLLLEFPNSKLAQKAVWDKAQGYERTLKLREAAESYLKFAMLFAKSDQAIDALLSAGIFFEANQKYAEAARAFEKLGFTYPDPKASSQAIFKSVELYAKAKELANQIALLESFIKRFRNEPEMLESVIEANVALGDALLNYRNKETKTKCVGAYKDAIAKFKKASHSPVAGYYAAKALFQLLELDFRDYRTLKIDAKLGKYQGVQLTKKTMKLSELKKRYEEIMEEFGGSRWSASSMQKVGELYEGLYHALLGAPCPSDVQAVEASACDEYRSLLEDKAFILEQKAIESFEKAIKLSLEIPDTQITRFQATEALNRLRPDEYPIPEQPILSLKRHDYPKKHELSHSDKGFEFFKLGQFEAAKIAFEDVVSTDASDALAHLWRAHSMAALGKKDAAMEAYQKALSLRANLSEAHEGIGLILLERDELLKAKESLKRALELNPKSATYASHLGVVFFKLKDWREALALFNRARDLDGTNASFHFNLGLVNYVGTFESMDELLKWKQSKEAFEKYASLSESPVSQGERLEVIIRHLNQKIAMVSQRRERENK